MGSARTGAAKRLPMNNMVKTDLTWFMIFFLLDDDLVIRQFLL
jgi:hypothetical protein